MGNTSFPKVYEVRTLVLSAGETRLESLFGNFFCMLNNDQATDVKVSFEEGQEQDFPAGLSLKLPADINLTKIFFRNPTGNVMTITFAMAIGEIYDARLTLQGSIFDSILNELQGDTTPENYGTIQVPALAPGVLVIASNNARKSAFVMNLPTNTGAMYVGFDNTLDSAGNKYAAVLLPGQSFSVDDYRGAIYLQAAVDLERATFGEV